MPDVKHKFASAISDGGDATLVRPSNWNDLHVWPDSQDLGSLTLTAGQFELQLNRIELTSTNRLTMSGTARIVAFGYTDGQVYNIVGFPKAPWAPFRVPSGWQFNQFERLVLGANTRGILEGSADMNLIDETSTSRLVLAGRG